MRKGFLRSVAVLLAGSGLALGQAPPPRNGTSGSEPPLFRVDRQPAQATRTTTTVQTAPAKPGDAPAAKPAPDKPVPPMPDKTGKDCTTPCHEPCAPACCEVCGPPGQCWFSAEYLLWWFKTGSTPPLLTSGTESSLGVLGQPGTTVLVGGRGLDRDPLHGGRFIAGTWLDCCQTMGIEIGYFFLSDRSTEYSAGGPGTPGSAVVARPFFNVLTGTQDSELVSFPNVVAGTGFVDANSRLWGVTPNLICNLCCCSPTDCCDPRGYRVDLLIGPRYYDLDEDINIREDLQVAPNVPALGGSRINIVDSFDTTNRFYGGFIGARGELWRNRLFVNATAGVSLGVTNQIVEINGNTVITPATGAAVNRPGGLLTQQTNIGRYSRNEFTWMPELGFNVGYQVTHSLRAFVGYSLIWWSDVARPGDQIDTGLNPSQLPTLTAPGTLVGPARPAFTFRDSDFWAQGVSFGVQFRY